MKKLILITGVILIGYLFVMEAAAPKAETSSVTEPRVQQQSPQSAYLIGVSEDRVAVYRGGELYLQTDTMLSSLPKSDRSRIEKGIYVYSEKELKLLLQDYCS